MPPSQSGSQIDILSSTDTLNSRKRLSKKASKISITPESIIPDGLLDKQAPTSSLTAENVENIDGDFLSEQPSLYEGSMSSGVVSQHNIRRMKSTGIIKNNIEGPELEMGRDNVNRLSAGDYGDALNEPIVTWSNNVSNSPSINIMDVNGESTESPGSLSPYITETRNFNPNEPFDQSSVLDRLSLAESVTQKHPFIAQMAPLTNFGFRPDFSDHEASGQKFFSKKKQIFILSSAGKPIYSMNGSDDIVTVYAGIIQTIVSFFQYHPDGSTQQLRSVTAKDRTGQAIKLVFADRSPILLMASSSTGESDAQLGQQLDLVYSFLIATLSKPHIEKVYEKRENFDLRSILGKTDMSCLDAICNNLTNFGNCGAIVGGLECLNIRHKTRKKLDSIFLKHRSDNLLYGLLVAPDGRLVNVLRPKLHTLHSLDLLLLFSMIYNTNTFRSTADQNIDSSTGHMLLSTNEDFWVPICLPKFNPNGFLYAFIQLVELKDEMLLKLHDLNMDVLSDQYSNMSRDSGKKTQLAVILISAFKDTFFEMRKASHAIVQDIKLNRFIFRDLYKAVVGTQGSDGTTGFPNGRISPIDIPAPLIKHFVFKNKHYTQFVSSNLQGSRVEMKTQHDIKIKGQIMQLYSHLRSRQMQNVTIRATDNKNNRNAGSPTLVQRGKYVDIVEWSVNDELVTGVLISSPAYDLYAISNGGVINRSTLLKSCKKIVRWCLGNSDRLLIRTGATF